MSILEDKSYDEHIRNWKKYIETNLIPIIKSHKVLLEGNIYSSHLSFNENDQLIDKQSNFFNLMHNIKPKNVLEIGFNAGFSCLFMVMINPNLDVTCVDINIHKYVVPCFNRMNQDFVNINLMPYGSHNISLPKLIEQNKSYDLIHIDGDHSIQGARKDLELCLKLSNDKTIIVFDDTNVDYLNNLCNEYVKKGIVVDYNLENFKNSQKYKHRILQVIKKQD